MTSSPDTCESSQVRQRFADDEGGRRDGRHPHLLHRARLLFPHDRQRRRDDRGDHRDVGDEPGHEKQRAAQLRVVPDAGLDGDDGPMPAGAERRRRFEQHRVGVAEHGRRRLRVVAVEDDLHDRDVAVAQAAREVFGDDEHGAYATQVDQAVDLLVGLHGRDVVEIGGAHEAGHQLAALRRVVPVLDRERHVADVEVERVAVEEQEERRQEQQHERRPPIPADLPQLLHGDRPGASHAAPRSARRSTTSRKTSSSDGTTVPMDVTVRPAPRRAATRASPVVCRVRPTACTAVPNRLVFSTAGRRVERRHRPHGIAARESRRSGGRRSAPSARTSCRAPRAGPRG